jgi:hypothetical protein
MIINEHLIINLKAYADSYITRAKSGLNTSDLKHSMTSLIPRVAGENGGVSMKPHPADTNPDIRKVLDGGNPALGIILVGVMEALQQIVVGGDREIPIETALKISRQTFNMLKISRENPGPGELWAFGFRDACKTMLPQRPPNPNESLD